MKKIILIACISALTVTFSINSHAKIYKWTDSKGVTHYSATPPAKSTKSKQKVKNIEDEIQRAAGKHRPKQAKTKNKDTQKKNVEKKETESESELSPPDKRLVDYCRGQKNNLASLTNNFRNVWIDAKGKKNRLNQKQRQEKVDYLKERIEKDCQEVETE